MISSGEVCQIFSDHKKKKKKLTYLSPGTKRRKGIGSTGKKSLPVGQKNFNKVMAIIVGLSLVLTQYDLFFRRGPRRFFQALEIRQRESEEGIPGSNKTRGQVSRWVEPELPSNLSFQHRLYYSTILIQ